MIWIYFIIGLVCSIATALAHLSAPQDARFWLGTVALAFIWPLPLAMALYVMWGEPDADA